MHKTTSNNLRSLVSLSSNAFFSSSNSYSVLPPAVLKEEMALFQPFLSHISLSKTTLPYSHHSYRPALSPLHPPIRPYHQQKPRQIVRKRTKSLAIAEIGGGLSVEDDHSVLVDPDSENVVRRVKEVVDYDWTEEWYPLYLTKNIPEDSPLGLTVFDKQVVLYKNGNGELQCYEDRCPHR